MRFRPATLTVFLLAYVGVTSARSEEAKIDFAHDIVPILKEHCMECHGGEEAEGGFSINTRRLFLEGEGAVPGDAEESLFLQLILDPDPEYRMPSEDKPPVPEGQVALLTRWADQGLEWEAGFTFGEPAYEPPLRPRDPVLPAAVDGREHPVDRLIDAYLGEGGYERPEKVDDAAFLRRVSLDLVGLLPTAEEARRFLENGDPNKRERKIDDLLSQEIEYTEHWLSFWNDLLRNDYDGTGFITGGRKQISRWLYDSLRGNKAYDVMVRELIAPAGAESSGFINGIKWRGVVSVAQSLPIQFSQSISQSLLGVNMKCASCHDSFIDRWTLEEAYGLAAIYSEEPLELFRCDKPTGKMATAAWLFPEIGQIDPAATKDERLEQLAALFIHPENGRVTRTMVNRLWGQLMGRGIVHPLDAMGTEPWDADLLDWLASDFQKGGYDIKRTLRRIATSQAYQSRAGKSDTYENGEYVYRGPSPKRLSAEQFVDAVWSFCDTAPAAFDAPVVRGEISEMLEETFSFSSSWVWGPSVDDGLPPHGESVLLRRSFSAAKPIRFAGLAGAGDNAFTLYLNREQIFSGTGGHNLQAASVASRLNDGDNEILIVAENRGSQPNAAGVFCIVNLDYEDGSSEVIVTDERWQASETIPEEPEAEDWALEKLAWEAARPLPEASWSEKIDPKIARALATTFVGSDKTLRASLFKADSLMRALGRPNRDQIVTSRPNDLTALEAVDLSTSAVLSTHLRSGARDILASFEGDRNVLIDEIYLGLLTRLPSKQEKALLRNALGRNPDAESLADILWAVVMTPEFLFIR